MASSGAEHRLRGVDLNLLVYFRALWEHRNTTVAAVQLNTSQPAVSASLKRLRLQFSDSLFTWDGNRMQPTPRAEALAPQILRTLASIESFSFGESSDNDGAGCQFIIASIDYIFGQMGADFTNSVFSTYPKLHLSFINFKPEMITQLRTLDVDLAIVPEELASSLGLARAFLFEDQYRLVRSKKFPAPASLEEFALREKAHFSAHPLELVDHEIWPEQPPSTNDASQLILPGQTLIPTFLSGSDRVALMTERMVESSIMPEDIVAEPPAFDVPPIRVTMVWPRNRNIEAMHKCIRDMVISKFA